MTQILNRYNSNIIAEGDMELRALVLHVVKTARDKGEIANLGFANLSFANLSFANLRFDNLRSADLRFDNLRSADLRSADLRSANLSSANLSSANMDYSSIPFRCASLKVKICDKLAVQMLFHAFALAKIRPTKTQIEFIRNFHRFDECGGVDTLDKCGGL